MITQDEHTARHSPRGACGLPAGSGGVGGPFSCRGAIDPDNRPLPCCKVCTYYRPRGQRVTWALTMTDFGRWQCERQCSVHRVTVRPLPDEVTHRVVSGLSTACGETR